MKYQSVIGIFAVARSIVLYMHMHQPYRVKQYSIFEVGRQSGYFDGEAGTDNERIFRKVAEKSYRPMLGVLEKCLGRHADFKFSLSITGTWLEQAERWGSDLIDTLKRLVATGRVELVAETYYHSLAFFYDRAEFEAQVRMHQDKIREVFGVSTAVFRNTELAYNDDLAAWAEGFGFRGILAEGWDKVLEWRSPNYVYRPEGCARINLLLKNYRLSDDLAFRFSDRKWAEWPLTVDKYRGWMNMEFLRGPLVNLFMDFETFGEHQWEDTGIFGFFERFVGEWLGEYENRFLTVSEACEVGEPAGEISMPSTVTWADTERDLTAWLGNAMQTEAMRGLYGAREAVIARNDIGLAADWRRLTTSDHAYFMCTKYFSDGDVHAYFSPYESPYDAFLYYMNVLRDLKFRAGLPVA
jgi:alpha-amylase